MEIAVKQQKIPEIIDSWYLEWKDKIVDFDTPHRLGFAKEHLKKIFEREMVFGNDEDNNN